MYEAGRNVIMWYLGGVHRTSSAKIAGEVQLLDMQNMTNTPTVAICNRVLGSFSKAWIERRKHGWYVCWLDYEQQLVSRRWSVRHGQSFFPPWSRIYPGGGTSITALSQLIRWLDLKPVLPLATWRYWASDKIKLLPVQTVDGVLSQAGYPEITPCVLCGEPLTGALDWWSLGKISGPCCTIRSGCCQKFDRSR